VVGREFSLDVVRRAAGLEMEPVLEALDAARRQGFVEAGARQTPRFTHALVQEAVYESIESARRRALHRRVGEAWRDLASADRGERLSAVAYHLCQVAEDVGAAAVDAAVGAAEHAEGRLAFEEAARLRELALDALDRVDPRNRMRRCDLLLGLARSQLGAREVSRACETARRAAALAREGGSAARLAEAALILSDYVLVDSSEPRVMLESALPDLPPERLSLRARSLAALSTHLWYDGQWGRRRALADEALALARTAGDRTAIVMALLAERHALPGPANLADRIRIASEALRETERDASPQRCLVLSWRAVDLLQTGDVVAADHDVALIERIADDERLIRFWGYPMRWRAMRATLEGRLDDAEKWISEAGARMGRSDDPNTQSYAGIQLGIVLLERVRVRELEAMMRGSPWIEPYRERVAAARAALALIELEAGRPGAAYRGLAEVVADDCAALDEDPELLGTMSWVAEACAQLGDRERAAILYDRLAPWHAQQACFYAIACRGSWARYLGLLAATAGRPEEAARCYEEALVANRQSGARLQEAWTAWDYARLLLCGRDRAARGRGLELVSAAARDAKRLSLGRLEAAMDAARGRGSGRY
jgi:hypothetical protein